MLSVIRSIAASFRAPSRRRNGVRNGGNAYQSGESLESRQLLTFSLGAPTAVELGAANTDEFAVGDINGDSLPDLAVRTSTPPGVSVALNNGQGGFSVRRVIDTAGFGVGLSDMNGDGRLDIVTRQDGVGFGYFAGRGDGTFLPGLNSITGSDTGNAFLVTDLNGNNIPEVIVRQSYWEGATRREAVGVYWDGARSRNNSGQYQALGNMDLTNGHLVAEDADGDTITDLVVRDSSGRIHVYRQSASRRLERMFVSEGTNGRVDYLQKKRVAVGDINGDGRPDLVTADSPSDQLVVLFGQATQTFSTPQYIASGGDSPIDVQILDVSNDGRKDLLVAHQGLKNDGSVVQPGDSVTVRLQNPGGGFSSSASYVAGDGQFGKIHPGRLIVADLTGDGVPDAIVGHNAMRRSPQNNIFSIPDSTLISVLPGRRETAGLPDLHAVGMSSPLGPVSIGDTDSDVSLTLVVRNSGTSTAPGNWTWRTQFYLSQDTILDSSDHFTNSQFSLHPTAPGETAVFNTSVSLPARNSGPWSGSGTYYILAKVDSTNSVAESNESNNFGLGIGIDIVPLQVRLNAAAPVIESQPALEMWPGQAVARRTVSVTDADGDPARVSASVVTLNRFLDQKYQFEAVLPSLQNQARMNEKWIWSASAGWFFVTPQGQLFRQVSAGASMTFEHISDVPTAVYSDPTQLVEPSAMVSLSWSVTVSENTLSVNTAGVFGIVNPNPFAVIVSATDGVHMTSAGFAVVRANSMAERLDAALNFSHQTTYPTNVLGLNEKLLSSAAGWHYILPNGRVHEFATQQFVAQLTTAYYQHPQLLHNASVFQLDQQYGFFCDAVNYAINATGRNEKWLGSSSGQRYFLLPGGELYRWNYQSGPALEP